LNAEELGVNLMVTHVDDHVACSPMITDADIQEVANEYDLIISLAETYELRYSPKKFYELGVEYIFEQVSEFTAPNVLRLFKLAYRVYNKALSGGKVLIHCSGGYSRSCTLAAAYMILNELSTEDALRKIATKTSRPLTVSRSQLRTLRLLEKLIQLLGPDGLASIIQFAERFKYGWGEEHSALVTEYSLELSNNLKEALGLDTLTEQVIATSSIVHDVGAIYDPDKHHVKTYELVSNSLEVYSVLGHETREAVAWAAYHHRRREWNPLTKSKVPLWCRPIVARASAVLQIADAIASVTGAEVREVELYPSNGDLILHLKWGGSINHEVAEHTEQLIRSKSKLLTYLLGVSNSRVIIMHDEFINSIITPP